MQIHPVLGSLEHPVLIPARFADTELIAGFLEGSHVRTFVPRVSHDENDIDDRLGRQVWN